MTSALSPLVEATTTINSQSNLANTDAEISIRICNRLANFIFENYPDEYDTELVGRLNQRSITQGDLEFAISIIDDITITRIESPNSRIIDIEPSNESTELKTSDVSRQMFILLEDEYNALTRYSEEFSTVENSQLEVEAPRRSLIRSFLSSDEGKACMISISIFFISGGVYSILKSASNEHYEIF